MLVESGFQEILPPRDLWFQKRVLQNNHSTYRFCSSPPPQTVRANWLNYNHQMQE